MGYVPPYRPPIGSTPDIEDTIQRINDLYAWADEHDPQPPWWRRRARRDWRLRWGVTP